MLVLLFAVYDGWQRRSAGGDTGFGLQGKAPVVRAMPHFRVGLYNIQGAVDKSNDALGKIGQTISPTDLTGLVEIRANARKSDSRNQAQQIAESLQRGWIFAPAEERFWAPGGGNGLVSRFPIGRWTRLPLPAGGDDGSQRNILLADMAILDRTVRIIVTHVDRGESRQRQLQAVAHLFDSIAGPAVLLADLNATPADPLLKPLFAAGAVDAIAKSGAQGAERVDWILVKGLNVKEAGYVNEPASSDHAFFWADLELLP